MFNVIIPVAGLGSRFVNAGYQIPKPFIPIKGKTMIEHVVANITEPQDKVYILCLLEHIPYISQTSLLRQGNVALIPVTSRTEGAACTVLLARGFIDQQPLIIANGDQWVKYDRTLWRRDVLFNKGNIMTFESDEPKWSYAQLKEDSKDEVLRVAEKKVISNKATVGVYSFRSGLEFLEAADRMIASNTRTNGEFYLCPVYNEYNLNGSGLEAIHSFPVQEMYGMGTPEDLERNYNSIG